MSAVFVFVFSRYSFFFSLFFLMTFVCLFLFHDVSSNRVFRSDVSQLLTVEFKGLVSGLIWKKKRNWNWTREEQSLETAADRTAEDRDIVRYEGAGRLLSTLVFTFWKVSWQNNLTISLTLPLVPAWVKENQIILKYYDFV